MVFSCAGNRARERLLGDRVKELGRRAFSNLWKPRLFTLASLSNFLNF